MRSLLIASWLLLLTCLPARAVDRNLQFTGTCVTETHVDWFGPASDDILDYTLSLTLDGPCGSVVGPLVGHLTINGHDDSWEGPIDPAFGCQLRGGELQIEDPQTGDTLMMGTMFGGDVVLYSETHVYPTFTAGYYAYLRRDLDSSCQWSELLSGSPRVTILASLMGHANGDGSYTYTVSGRMEDAFVTAVPTGATSWGTLKSSY